MTDASLDPQAVQPLHGEQLSSAAGTLTAPGSQLTALCGVEHAFQERFRDNVPLIGLFARQSKVVESYYRFAPKESALHDLLHHLFYRAEGVEFEPSKRAQGCTRYLGPRAIGMLAGALAAWRTQSHPTIGPVELTEMIRTDCAVIGAVARQQHRFQEMRCLADQAIALFRTTQEQVSLLTQEVEESKAQYLADMARRSKLIAQALRVAPAELRAEIEGIAQQRGSALATRNVHRARTPEERAELIAFNRVQEQRRTELILQRKQLCERAILLAGGQLAAEAAEVVVRIDRHERLEESLVHRVEQLRIAGADKIKQLWGSCDEERAQLAKHIKFKRTGRYFDQYLDTLVATFSPAGALEQHLPAVVRALYRLAEEVRFGAEAQIATVALMNLLSHRIATPVDQQRYLEGFRAVFPGGMTADYLTGETTATEPQRRLSGEMEQAALELYRLARLESPTPPMASTRFVTVSVDGVDLSFPDCGEATVRGFFNLILYDPVSQRYDAQRLRELDLSVSPAVIQFYERNPEVEATSSQRVHNEWAIVMSNLGAGVEYILPSERPCVELKPGAANMDKVLTALFGTNDWRILAAELPRVSKMVNAIDASSFDPSGASGEFQNKVLIRAGDTVVEWYFLTRHFRMYERVDAVSQSREELGMSRYFETFANTVGSVAAFTLIAPLLRKQPVDAIKHLPPYSNALVGGSLYGLLSARFDWVEDIFSVCRAALSSPPSMQNECSRGMIRALALSIPWFDGHQQYREQLAAEIEESRNQEFSDLVPLLRSQTMTGDGGQLLEHRSRAATRRA